MATERFTMHQSGTPYEVVANIGEITVDAELDFDNMFGSQTMTVDQSKMGVDLPVGSAKLLCLRHGVKELEIGGEELDLSEGAVGRSVKDSGFGGLRDKETLESVLTRLVKLSVHHNPWLYKLEPYSAVFGPFAPAQEKARKGGPEKNPTTDTSKSSATSTTSHGSDVPNQSPPNSPDSGIAITRQGQQSEMQSEPSTGTESS